MEQFSLFMDNKKKRKITQMTKKKQKTLNRKEKLSIFTTQHNEIIYYLSPNLTNQ